MTSQSRRITGLGSSYLEEVGNDFGGKKAAEIGQKAATRYLAQLESSGNTHRPKPYAIAGAICLTAYTLATNLGEAREVLVNALQQF